MCNVGVEEKVVWVYGGAGRQAGRQAGTDECNDTGSCIFTPVLLVIPSSIDRLKKQEEEKEGEGGEERRSPHFHFLPRIMLTP